MTEHERLEHDGKQRAREQRAALFTRLAIVAALALGVVIVGLQLNLTIMDLRVTRDVRETAERVESCSIPAGDCYQLAERRTSTAIGSVNRVTIFAAECAAEHRGPGPARASAIRRCIIAKAKAAGAPPLSPQ